MVLEFCQNMDTFFEENLFENTVSFHKVELLPAIVLPIFF